MWSIKCKSLLSIIVILVYFLSNETSEMWLLIICTGLTTKMQTLHWLKYKRNVESAAIICSSTWRNTGMHIYIGICFLAQQTLCCFCRINLSFHPWKKMVILFSHTDMLCYPICSFFISYKIVWTILWVSSPPSKFVLLQKVYCKSSALLTPACTVQCPHNFLMKIRFK